MSGRKLIKTSNLFEEKLIVIVINCISVRKADNSHHAAGHDSHEFVNVEAVVATGFEENRSTDMKENANHERHDIVVKVDRAVRLEQRAGNSPQRCHHGKHCQQQKGLLFAQSCCDQQTHQGEGYRQVMEDDAIEQRMGMRL